jgi:transposase
MNEHWQLFLALLGLVAGWSVIIIAALRVMFGRSFNTIDDKIATFIKTVEDKLVNFSGTEKACSDLQRELLELKAAMPLEYVRREDFIRFEVGINYKLDKLRDLFVDTYKEKK